MRHLDEEVIQFLLKSFVDGQWRFNVPLLAGNGTITSLVGNRTRHGAPLPSSFVAAIRPALPTPVAILCWRNSREHALMS